MKERKTISRGFAVLAGEGRFGITLGIREKLARISRSTAERMFKRGRKKRA
jgi:hypothetical protein